MELPDKIAKQTSTSEFTEGPRLPMPSHVVHVDTRLNTGVIHAHSVAAQQIHIGTLNITQYNVGTMIQMGEPLMHNATLANLIQQLKFFYQHNDNKMQSIFGSSLPLEEYFINLTIVKCQQYQYVKNNPTSTRANRSPKFTKYENVYDITRKDIISIEEIFNTADNNTPRRVALIGMSGTGKSTISQYITSFLWAQKNLWQNRFDIVIKIKLRNLSKDKYDKNPTLAEIIALECQDRSGLTKILEKSAIANILQAVGERTLVILDGLNEFNQIRSPALATIQSLLNNPKAYILVLSQPSASLSAFQFDLILECIGFSTENIYNYIKRHVKDQNKASHIIEWLKRDVIIESLAHNPLMLNIICEIFDKDIILQSPQISSTDLFSKMIIKLWETYKKKKREFQQETDTPKLNLNKNKVKECLDLLAFKASIVQKTVISYDLAREVIKEIYQCADEDVIDYIDELLLTGFLYSSSHNQENAQYYFQHARIHDFFAAEYLVTLFQLVTRFEFNKILQSHKFNPSFSEIWPFVTGLLYRHTNKKLLDNFILLMLAEPREPLCITEIPLLIACFNECHFTFSAVVKPYTDKEYQHILLWIKKALSPRNYYLFKQLSQVIQTKYTILYQVEIMTLFTNALLSSDEWVKTNSLAVLLQSNLPEKMVNEIIKNITLQKRGGEISIAALKSRQGEFDLETIGLIISALKRPDDWVVQTAHCLLSNMHKIAPQNQRTIFDYLRSSFDAKKRYVKQWLIAALAKLAILAPDLASEIYSHLVSESYLSHSNYDENELIQCVSDAFKELITSLPLHIPMVLNCLCAMGLTNNQYPMQKNSQSIKHRIKILIDLCKTNINVLDCLMSLLNSNNNSIRMLSFKALKKFTKQYPESRSHICIKLVSVNDKALRTKGEECLVRYHYLHKPNINLFFATFNEAELIIIFTALSNDTAITLTTVKTICQIIATKQSINNPILTNHINTLDQIYISSAIIILTQLYQSLTEQPIILKLLVIKLIYKLADADQSQIPNVISIFENMFKDINISIRFEAAIALSKFEYCNQEFIQELLNLSMLNDDYMAYIKIIIAPLLKIAKDPIKSKVSALLYSFLNDKQKNHAELKFNIAAALAESGIIDTTIITLLIQQGMLIGNENLIVAALIKIAEIGKSFLFNTDQDSNSNYSKLNNVISQLTIPHAQSSWKLVKSYFMNKNACHVVSPWSHGPWPEVIRLVEHTKNTFYFSTRQDAYNSPKEILAVLKLKCADDNVHIRETAAKELIQLAQAKRYIREDIFTFLVELGEHDNMMVRQTALNTYTQLKKQLTEPSINKHNTSNDDLIALMQTTSLSSVILQKLIAILNNTDIHTTRIITNYLKKFDLTQFLSEIKFTSNNIDISLVEICEATPLPALIVAFLHSQQNPLLYAILCRMLKETVSLYYHEGLLCCYFNSGYFQTPAPRTHIIRLFSLLQQLYTIEVEISVENLPQTYSTALLMKTAIDSISAKKYQIAISQFEQIIVIDNQHVESYWYLVGIYYQLQNLIKAIECCQKIISIEPDFPIAYHNLGCLYFVQKLPDLAEEQFKTALQLSKEARIDIYCEYSHFLFLRNRRNECLALLQNTILINDNKKMLCYSKLEFDLLDKEMQQIIEANNNLVEIIALHFAFRLLVRIILIYNDLAQAKVVIEKFELSTEDCNSALSFYLLGLCFTDIKDSKKALSSFKTAIELSPDNHLFRQSLEQLVRKDPDATKDNYPNNPYSIFSVHNLKRKTFYNNNDTAPQNNSRNNSLCVIS